MKETIYYPELDFVRIVNSSGTYNFDYIYHEGVLIAQSQGGNKTYFLTDHEGSVRVAINSTGVIIENTSYSPYGEVLSGGNKEKYQYEAKEYSTVVKDMDFNARKYRSDLAIFTQPGTIIQNVYDPQGLLTIQIIYLF